MALSRLSPVELYEQYAKWVGEKPNLASELEATVKWGSYFLAGRFKNSGVLSELIYSASNLLVLLNDHIIRQSRNLNVKGSGERLRLMLTVLEYLEVFAEITASKLWGETGRWGIIVVIQILKAAWRLLLVFKYKVSIIQTPSKPPLNRKQFTAEEKIEEGQRSSSVAGVDSGSSIVFTLQRSGRVIRKINAAPPSGCRTWKLPHLPPNNNLEKGREITPLQGKFLVAEVLHITKPLAHLLMMGMCGRKAWKPFLLALAMDITSLKLHGYRIHPTMPEKMELVRRKASLLLYLLRSPVYDCYTRERIQRTLECASRTVPLAAYLCRPLALYIPEWQNMYSYIWSS